MKKWMMVGLIAMLVTGCIGSSMALADGSGKLTVKIDGFRNADGTVWVSLFKSGDGFPVPVDGNMAGVVSVQIEKDLTATAVFEDIPYGEYAVSVLHDENSNQQLDMGDSGIPAEGFGVSNNMDPQNYDQAKFMLKSADQELKIHVVYMQ